MNIKKIILLKSDQTVINAVSAGLKILNPENHILFFGTTSPAGALRSLIRLDGPAVFVSGNWFLDMNWRLGRVASAVRGISPQSIMIGYANMAVPLKREIPQLDAFIKSNEYPWKFGDDERCQHLVSLNIKPCVYPLLRVLALPFDQCSKNSVIEFIKKDSSCKREIKKIIV